MVRIAVFDSGLGSLSIIRAIQKISKVEIIYFADQNSFPYGGKSKNQLEKIINKSVNMLREKFSPDLIVVGSNTPTIMLGLEKKGVIGVNPPLKEASKITKTKNIGILGTNSAIRSKELSKYIKNCKINSEIKIHKINGSPLVELVESGKFLTNKTHCKKLVRTVLENFVIEMNIDVIILSSTHLPFLRHILEKQFPNILFIDPANSIAKIIHKKIRNMQRKNNKLRIFCSGNTTKFRINLLRIGIKNKVNFLSI